MSASSRVAAAETRSRVPPALWLAAVSGPVIGLVILLAAPDADVRWEHHPAHFWLVLGTALVSGALAYTTGDAARRRGDARLWLVSLACLAAAGFLGLHALATPQVLLEKRNAGFVIATPVGLLLAAVLAALSAAPMDAARSAAVMRRATAVRVTLLALMAAWAALSLAEVAPLDGAASVDESTARSPLRPSTEVPRH